MGVTRGWIDSRTKGRVKGDAHDVEIVDYHWKDLKRSTLYFRHPGEILRTEFLDELHLSQYKLAVDTGIPHSRVTASIKGRRAITPDTALRLSRYFGTSAEFW